MQSTQPSKRRKPGPVVGLAAIAVTIAATATLSGCNSGIYLRNGVVDGDTFYIPPQAAVDPDPVVQAWIRYSLARSLCQIELADENPARATSFDCEHRGREQLVGAWIEYTEANPTLSDDYLDDLRFVYRSGLLPEYVAANFARRSWSLPPDLDTRRFRRWQRTELRGHRPTTRLIGNWVYGRKSHVHAEQ